MLSLPSNVRIFLAKEPTDMRKGFDSLHAMVRQQEFDLFDGHLFVFISKRRKHVKVLCWSKGGLCLYYKRLERGTFQLPKFDEQKGTVQLESAQLAMLLDGLDYTRVPIPRRWSPMPKKSSGQNAQI